MKVLLIASGDFLSDYGGGQVYVRSIAAGLRARGHDLTVAALRPTQDADEVAVTSLAEGPFKLDVLNVPVLEVDASRPPEFQTAVLASARAYLEQQRPDVVHANGWKATFATVCHELGVPCTITAHHAGIVCPAGALLDWRQKLCTRALEKSVCARCCRRTMPAGIVMDPLVTVLPGRLVRALDVLLARLPNVPFLTPAIRATTAPDRVAQSVRSLALPGTMLVAPSGAIRDALARNGIPADQLAVVPHGVAPFSPRPGAGSSLAGPVRFLYIGRLNYCKGLHVLLEALKRIQAPTEWELHIAGQALTKPERRYERSLRKTNVGRSNINWHGQLGREDVGALLRASDVLVLPSICVEVFGLVVPEAFSAGLPVIATRSGGPEELIEDGFNGRLVAPGDPAELTLVLAEVLRNRACLRTMAENIGPVLTIDEHLSKLESVYARAISLRSGAPLAQLDRTPA